jgi:hypothetical protein
VTSPKFAQTVLRTTRVISFLALREVLEFLLVRSLRLGQWRSLVGSGSFDTRNTVGHPSPGGVAQLVERVLYHSTRRAVPERSWVQSLLPTTEVEPGFSTFGGMLVPVLQLISPVCKTGTSLPKYGRSK